MNKKVCAKCGNSVESDAKFCTNCGSSEFNGFESKEVVNEINSISNAPKKRMPTWLKVLIIFGVILLIIGGCTVGCTIYVGKLATDFVTDTMETVEEDLDGVIEDIESEVESQVEEQTNANISEKKLGDTFVFDDLEITLGSEVEVFTLNDQSSVFNGKDFVKIPITVRNKDIVENKLKSFYFNIYKNENIVTKMGYLFEDSIDNATYLKTDESYDKYIYFLYESDFSYKLKFYDYTYTINVTFDVTK